MAHPGRFTRCAAALLVSAFALAGMAGCSTQPPQTPSPGKVDAYPSLTDKQVSKVIEQIDKSLKAADKANDPKPLQARLDNPAYTMRAAQYALKAKDTQIGYSAIPTKPISVTVTSTTKWPRAIVDVTEAPPGGLPHILVIRQRDPRSPYKLSQWMRVLPGKSIPSTAIVKKGSPALAGQDQSGLPLSPFAARDAWAKAVLDPKAQQSSNIAEDVLMSSIRAEQKQLRDAIGDSGSVEAQIIPGKDVVALKLDDGGALVACNYNYRTTLTVKPGKPGIQAQGNVGVLLGEDGKITDAAHWTYEVTTLLRIPPATQKDKKIEVIGGEKVLYEAARQ